MSALLTFVRAFWKPLLIVVIALAVLFALRHYGDVRYRDGRIDEKADWLPRMAAAEQAKAAAEAHTAAIETAQEATTANSEARHAEAITAVNARAADAERRIRALSLRLAARNTCSGQVPAVPDSTSQPHVPSPSEERAVRIGNAITDIGRRCELDAGALADLQQWIREQAALRTN